MKKIFSGSAFILFFILFATLINSCKKDKCKNIFCGTGGSCNEGVCVCDSVHEDVNCKTETRARYLGNHVFGAACDSINHLDYVGFLISDSGANKIKIVNLHSEGDTNVGTVLADGTVFIPEQSLGSGTVTGRVFMSNGKIVINFIANSLSGDDTCVWTQKW